MDVFNFDECCCDCCVGKLVIMDEYVVIEFFVVFFVEFSIGIIIV